LTAGGKYEPDDMRFHSLYGLPCRSCPNCSIVTPSTPGCALVGLNPLIRLLHHPLRDTRRLGPILGLDPFTWLLPGTPVDHQTGPGRPAPFTPPPLQRLHRCYEAVRPPAAHQYSAPCSFSCLESSLTPTDLNTPVASIAARSSHVPHRRLTRAPATFMPDTAWPGPQAPARLIPGQDPGPGSDADCTLSAQTRTAILPQPVCRAKSQLRDHAPSYGSVH
jgi:hypothetical protein